MKLLHKNDFFHNFTPLIAEILAFKLCPCRQKVDFKGQYHYHSWRDHILDMLSFNCIRLSSPLSNFSFQLDLVAGIALTNFDMLVN